MAVDPAEVAGQVQDGAADQGGSPEPTDQEQSNPGWFQGLLGRITGRAAPDQAGGTPGGGDETTGEPEPTNEPKPVTLTEAELETRVQAEANRREAKRQWEGALEAADAGDTRQLRVMAARGHGPAQRELAKRGETYELGEAVAESLQRQASTEAAVEEYRAIGNLHDQHTLVPLLNSLPEAEREKVLKDAEHVTDGFQHRQAVAEGILKAHQRLALEQAKDELRKDPVFRKEVLISFRGTPEHQEPDLIEAVSASAPGSVDSLIRQAVGVR